MSDSDLAAAAGCLSGASFAPNRSSHIRQQNGVIIGGSEFSLPTLKEKKCGVSWVRAGATSGPFQSTLAGV